ncbi:MAG TPA: hypothetical protein VFV08_16850 [Puia sp.]|nr:hypothetical protein [Puia sp.]
MKLIRIPLIGSIPDLTKLPSERSSIYLRKAWTLSRMSDVNYQRNSIGCVLIHRRRIVGVGTETDSYDGLANAMRSIDVHDSELPYVRAFVIMTNRKTGSIIPMADEYISSKSDGKFVDAAIGTIYFV